MATVPFVTNPSMALRRLGSRLSLGLKIHSRTREGGSGYEIGRGGVVRGMRRVSWMSWRRKRGWRVKARSRVRVKVRARRKARHRTRRDEFQ